MVQALISASKANITLDYDRACAIDLAGRDVQEAVGTSVNPKVIDVPSGQMARNTIDGIAGDGIQLKVKARVTVRTNLDRLVGGATEETIVARVGEGIVTTIGSSQNHMAVLENPDRISKVVLERGLDSGTAFEILSIDIADVDVGDNIGARLKIDQAEAEKQVAQAQAERQRALAVAREQEMVALVQENRAKVVLAEAEVPKAMADAFRAGNLGVMDYYNMQNVISDTRMRRSIAGEGDDARRRRRAEGWRGSGSCSSGSPTTWSKRARSSPATICGPGWGTAPGMMWMTRTAETRRRRTRSESRKQYGSHP